MQAQDFIDFFKNIGPALAVFGAALAGAWTYHLYVKFRKAYPKATITLTHWSKIATDDSRLLSVGLEIKNTGDILISIDCIQCIFYQIIPFDTEDIERIKSESRNESKTTIDWPILGRKEIYYDKYSVIEIEPNEEHFEYFDLIFSSDIHAIQAYAFIRNPKKRNRVIGWTKQIFIELTKNEGTENLNVRTSGKATRKNSTTNNNARHNAGASKGSAAR